MNMRWMKTGSRRYSLSAALAGLGLMASMSSAGAQTISGGTVSGTAGQTASVPITINTGSANVAFFAVTFTVVPQGGAPAIADKLTYTTVVTPGPDLSTAIQAQAKLAIGYAGATIDPPLSGTVVAGNLMVPIPAGATGSYDVQLAKVSAGDSSGAKVTLTPSDGTISLGGAQPTATPTTPAGPGPNTLNGGSVSGAAGQMAAVPITINTGTDNVAFFAVTFTVVAQGGAPTVTDKLTYTSIVVPGPDLSTAIQAQQKLAIGYAGATIDPPLSGIVEVGTLMVPIPAGAAMTGSYDVQLSKISAGNSSGGKVTLAGTDGTINLGTGPLPTATTTPTNTVVVVPTNTPTNTVVVPVNTATATRTKTATPTSTSGAGPSPAPFDDDGGCHISTAGGSTSGWLLLIPAMGLLVLRRRQR